MYTDGVPEATSEEQELFGTDRMIEALRTHETALPEDILTSVRQSVEEFVGPAEQFDDLTMLCIDYHGSPMPDPEPESAPETEPALTQTADSAPVPD